MSSLVQLYLLGVNFFYGFLIFIITVINHYFIKNETVIVKCLLTLLFAIDFTILYLILIYKINYGMFHLYYLFAFGGGYYLAYVLKKHVKIVPMFKKIIDNIKY